MQTSGTVTVLNRPYIFRIEIFNTTGFRVKYNQKNNNITFYFFNTTEYNSLDFS